MNYGSSMRRWALDLGVVALLAVAMYAEAWLRGCALSPAAVVAIAVAPLPTLLRRTHPGWGLALCMALLYVVFLFVDVHNTVPFSSMLCGYSLALVVDRRRALLAGLVLVPFVVGALVLFSHEPRDVLVGLPQNLAFVAAPLLLGVAVRNRRDYLAALLDRAETAERTREEEAARRVSEERLRIAQDVHDVVAHAMVAINVQAGVGMHLLDRDPERARRTLADIRQASGDALTDLRSTLGVLRSSEAPVAPAQSLADLSELAAGLRSAGLDVALHLDPGALSVSSGTGTTGYRIVQEALTNVVRHAGSAHARIDVRRLDGQVVISVDDDGPTEPRPPAPAGSGNGVRGMSERAAALGGTVEAGPHGDGWRVRAVLPT